MRTTVDIDQKLLARAKRLAQKERRTLGVVVNEALAAYLGNRKPNAKDPPFELLVRGKPQGRFPSAAEIAAVEDEDAFSALAMPLSHRRHATP